MQPTTTPPCVACAVPCANVCVVCTRSICSAACQRAAGCGVTACAAMRDARPPPIGGFLNIARNPAPPAAAAAAADAGFDSLPPDADAYNPYGDDDGGGDDDDAAYGNAYDTYIPSYGGGGGGAANDPFAAYDHSSEEEQIAEATRLSLAGGGANDDDDDADDAVDGDDDEGDDDDADDIIEVDERGRALPVQPARPASAAQDARKRMRALAKLLNKFGATVAATRRPGIIVERAPALKHPWPRASGARLASLDPHSSVYSSVYLLPAPHTIVAVAADGGGDCFVHAVLRAHHHAAPRYMTEVRRAIACQTFVEASSAAGMLDAVRARIAEQLSEARVLVGAAPNLSAAARAVASAAAEDEVRALTEPMRAFAAARAAEHAEVASAAGFGQMARVLSPHVFIGDAEPVFIHFFTRHLALNVITLYAPSGEGALGLLAGGAVPADATFRDGLHAGIEPAGLFGIVHTAGSADADNAYEFLSTRRDTLVLLHTGDPLGGHWQPVGRFEASLPTPTYHMRFQPGDAYVGQLVAGWLRRHGLPPDTRVFVDAP